MDGSKELNIQPEPEVEEVKVSVADACSWWVVSSCRWWTLKSATTHSLYHGDDSN